MVSRVRNKNIGGAANRSFRFWLEKQTPSEPFAFTMYDTKGGTHARCE